MRLVEKCQIVTESLMPSKVRSLQASRMAEREGFEPPVPFRVRRFSRPEPSTTRPPLRIVRDAHAASWPLLVSLQHALSQNPHVSQRQRDMGHPCQWHYIQPLLRTCGILASGGMAGRKRGNGTP